MSDQPPKPNWQRGLWIAAILGVALCAWLATRDRAAFFPAYLIAFVYWFGISLGALLLGLVHGLTGGRWGEPIAAPVAAAARTMPLLAILFLPVAMNLDALYAWAGNLRPAAVALSESAMGKQAAVKQPESKAPESKAAAPAAMPHGINRRYLNPSAFCIRTAIYFALWTFFAFAGTRRPSSAATAPGAPRSRLPVAGWGLALCGATGTLAAVDWMMSLDAPWYSTIYGVLVVIGQCLLALSLLILMTLSRNPPGRVDLVLSRDRLHDLGNLMLTLVMLWAYMGFSQYLLIWAGNLPDENTWYIARSHHGWSWAPGVMIAFHFALPFALLLSREMKRRTTMMAAIAFAMMFFRWLDLTWLVMPVFQPSPLPSLAHQAVAMLAVGSLWLIGFSLQMPPTRPSGKFMQPGNPASSIHGV